MAYQTQTERISQQISERLKRLNGEGTRLSNFISEIVIQGFREENIEKILKHFERLSYCSIKWEEDFIFPFIEDERTERNNNSSISLS